MRRGLNSTRGSDRTGIFLHARHAFMPNSLGYCGPDDRGKILEHIQESSSDEGFVSILQEFEAAYPFIHFIAKSTGRTPFDRKVTEAYWIGNDLLDRVAPDDFYKFTRTDLKENVSRVNPNNYRNLFFSNNAIPHHSFYVMATALNILSDVHVTSAPAKEKISEIVDNCMISWGRVVGVDKNHLMVERARTQVDDGGLIKMNKRHKLMKVKYDSTMPPFQDVQIGDTVSVHWNFACDILSEKQLRNIKSYTERDASAMNSFIRDKRLKPT